MPCVDVMNMNVFAGNNSISCFNEIGGIISTIFVRTQAMLTHILTRNAYQQRHLKKADDMSYCHIALFFQDKNEIDISIYRRILGSPVAPLTNMI